MSDAAATPVVEAPAPTEAAAPAAEAPKHTPNPDTRKFAALTRKERQISAKLFEQKQTAAKYEAYEKALQIAKANPDQYLKAGGLTYDDITNHYLKGINPDDPAAIARAAAQAAEATGKEFNEFKTAVDQRYHSEAVTQYKTEMRKELGAHLEKNPDEYGVLNALDAYDDVFKMIDLHWQEKGVKLENAVAAKLYESTAFEEETKHLDALLSVPKFKAYALSKLQVVPPAPETPKESAKLKPNAQATAKSNNSEAKASPAKSPSRMSRQAEDEQRWSAILARANAMPSQKK